MLSYCLNARSGKQCEDQDWGSGQVAHPLPGRRHKQMELPLSGQGEDQIFCVQVRARVVDPDPHGSALF
jgi:hypothetical protein